MWVQAYLLMDLLRFRVLCWSFEFLSETELEKSLGVDRWFRYYTDGFVDQTLTGRRPDLQVLSLAGASAFDLPIL